MDHTVWCILLSQGKYQKFRHQEKFDGLDSIVIKILNKRTLSNTVGAESTNIWHGVYPGKLLHMFTFECLIRIYPRIILAIFVEN